MSYKIEYIVAQNNANPLNILIEGSFDADSIDEQRTFVTNCVMWWSKGLAVITRKAETKK